MWCVHPAACPELRATNMDALIYHSAEKLSLGPTYSRGTAETTTTATATTNGGASARLPAQAALLMLARRVQKRASSARSSSPALAAAAARSSASMYRPKPARPPPCISSIYLQTSTRCRSHSFVRSRGRNMRYWLLSAATLARPRFTVRLQPAVASVSRPLVKAPS